VPKKWFSVAERSNLDETQIESGQVKREVEVAESGRAGFALECASEGRAGQCNAVQCDAPGVARVRSSVLAMV
jgi:hypothetical protein